MDDRRWCLAAYGLERWIVSALDMAVVQPGSWFGLAAVRDPIQNDKNGHHGDNGDYERDSVNHADNIRMSGSYMRCPDTVDLEIGGEWLKAPSGSREGQRGEGVKRGVIDEFPSFHNLQ